MSGEIAGRSPIEYLFFGVMDFICLLLAAESLNALQYRRAVEWVVAGIASVLFGYYWPRIKVRAFRPSVESSEPKKEEKNPTLFDLFKNDFGRTLRAGNNEPSISIEWADGTATKITSQVYMDFDARTKFAGFYVPRPPPPSTDISGQTTFSACMKLIEMDAAQTAFERTSASVGIQMGRNEQMTNLQELVFSGRVFIYHEDFLSIPQKAEIIRVSQLKGIAVEFRGSDYLGVQVVAWHRERDAKAKRGALNG